MEEKHCSGCKLSKPVSEFYLNARRGFQDKCKVCKAAYNKIHYQNNKEKYKSNAQRRRSRPEYRDRVIEYRHGDKKTYVEMLACQGGVCAICKQPPDERRRLCIDHSHETGEVRGLLCSSCNVGLGNFKDSDTSLLSAVEYLKKTTNTIIPEMEGI